MNGARDGFEEEVWGTKIQTFNGPYSERTGAYKLEDESVLVLDFLEGLVMKLT